ncbi:putative transporter mfs2 [Cytospora mali]|uniref:Transporter mfs2 n=1 Tax=Cytospora mali TaxID=578113 RepID=A0A194UM44_CYTMA|nr:putative transporter mfs2 [Valsa mali var. pyri (nom. inval.)]
MSPQDVEKQEQGHLSPAPPVHAETSHFSSSDSTNPSAVENGVAGRQTGNVPGAEKVDEDGNIIHTWYGPDDPENPFNWSPVYKWVVTVTICFVSILTGLPAGSYGAGSSYYAEEFRIRESPFDNSIWATVSWNIGAAVWPLIFVPLTESKGRMPGYFGAYIIFVAFLFGSAFAQNYATLIVTRFFGGGASSVAINIVGGSIADVWKGDEARSLPMSLFGFTSVAGIALGPFVGSVIVQIHKSFPWRWIFYVQIIYNAGLIPMFWFILRETRADVILARRAKKLRKETGKPIYAESEFNRQSTVTLLKMSFYRPARMLTTEPVVIFFTLWVSFAWGILFLFFSSVVQTFQSAYDFNTLQTGLVQLAISAGAIIATFINPMQDRLYVKSASRNKERPGKPIPEARLYSSVPGSILFAAGLFWYGWSCRTTVHWIVPTCGIACVGIGIYSIYLGVVNYLTDAYEKYAASALSAASLGRNVFGAFLPLASKPLFTNLGFGWAGSLLGFIGLAMVPIPIVLLFKGEAIRANSPLMSESTYDDDEVEARRSSYVRAHSARNSVRGAHSARNSVRGNV